jgi:hypothetical protein
MMGLGLGGWAAEGRADDGWYMTSDSRTITLDSDEMLEGLVAMLSQNVDLPELQLQEGRD